MKFQKKFSRLIAIVAACIALGLGGYAMGLRSATQHDHAYFAIKEMKIMAMHEMANLKKSLSSPTGGTSKYATDEIKVFTGNDFSLELLHIPSLSPTERTAGFVTDGHGDVVKVEQNDVMSFWALSEMDSVIQDALPTTHRGGGLKQIFTHHQQRFGLVSLQKQGPEGCYFASLVNFTLKKEVFRAPCLPAVDEIDFSSIGGAWTETAEGILMSLGTPSDDDRIAMLAQDPTSPYGKVLAFKDAQLQGQATSPIGDFQVHSSGHRNPQGMVTIGNNIYSIDHGPKGGDEINLLERGRNYGWPLYSLGSTYQGQPHKPMGDLAKYTAPLFSFVPSIAPSDITTCPTELAQRYVPLRCVLISSLRGMSIFVGLIDSNHRILSLERITVDMRLREFFRLPNGHLAVSTDGFGVYQIDIGNMPTLH